MSAMVAMRAWVRLMLAVAACALVANWGSLRPLTLLDDAGGPAPEAVQPAKANARASQGPLKPPPRQMIPSSVGCVACHPDVIELDSPIMTVQGAAPREATQAGFAAAVRNSAGPAVVRREPSLLPAVPSPLERAPSSSDHGVVDIGLSPPFSPRRMHLRQPAIRRNCSTYVSIWPSNVGFGHVQQNRNAAHLAAHLAELRGADVCYAFPFSHATRHKGDGGQGAAWDRFLRFEAAFDTLDAVVAQRRTVHLGWRKSHLWPSDVLRKEVERDLAHPANGTVYLLPPDSELVDNCWPMGPLLRSTFDHHSEARLLRYRPSCYSVALHVRRGDSLKKNKKARYVGLSYFIAVAELLTALAGPQLCFYLFSDSSDTSEFQPFVQRWPNSTTLCTDVNAVDTFHHLIKADVLVASKSGLSYIAATMAVGLVLFPSSFWRFTKCDDLWIQTTVQAEPEGLLNRTQLEAMWHWYARYHPIGSLTHLDLPVIPQTSTRDIRPDVSLRFGDMETVEATLDVSSDSLRLPRQAWRRLTSLAGFLKSVYNALDAHNSTTTTACNLLEWAAGDCGVSPRTNPAVAPAVSILLSPPPPLPPPPPPPPPSSGASDTCQAMQLLLAPASFLRLGDDGTVWSRLRPHDAPHAVLGQPVLHCVELLRTQDSHLRLAARPDRSPYCLNVRLEPCGPSALHGGTHT